MRVTVIAQQVCAPVPGGTGRYAAGLVQALASTAGADDRVRAVVARRCPAADALGAPVQAIGLPERVLSRLWERNVGPGPDTDPGDVIHASTLLVPPARPGRHLVVTIHDVVPWSHPHTLTPRGVRFHRRMGRRAAQQAAIVVTPTEAVAAAVRDVLAPRCPVLAVGQGVPVLVQPSDPVASRARLGVTDREYVLFVGTVEPRKGLDILVAAMARPELAGLDLVLVGPSGWGDLDAGALCRDAGLGERARILGKVDDRDLAALYAGAQVLAMPSRAEGFGLPVVEAMSQGTPVVTSSDPALVEVGGQAALVAETGSVEDLARALDLAAHDPSTRARLTAAGPARAASFTWAATADRLWHAYRSLG